jgi:AcrR family transcriptional regulator
VGELVDRRARKKAQTRQQIRAVAQRLFNEQGFEAVTISDVARVADVAVQTVFNHFATKEELFFDGRTSWVDSPADAVRSREPSVPPLTALRAHLVDLVTERVSAYRSPDRRRTIATVEASDALRAYERLLLHEAEVKLRHALLEAWTSKGAASLPDPESAALLIAAVWVAAVGALVLGQRPSLTAGADPEVTAATATDLADRVLRQLELGANAVHGRAQASRVDTGWPQDVRQAG